MEITELGGNALPEPIEVYGWHFDGQGADQLSRKVWDVAQSESLRLDKGKGDGSSCGVFRVHAPDDLRAWDVWVVDRQRQLRTRSTRVAWLYRSHQVEPDAEIAELLVARHLRFLLSHSQGGQVERHHDPGQQVDAIGRDIEQ